MSELKLQQCRVDNRFDVIERLGSPGSYAEVYIARDITRPADAQIVVIKALNAYLQGTPDFELERKLIENFRNEAVALDRVRHPHIISRLGHGTAIDLTGATFHYLVLEYMEGGDVAKLCRRAPLGLRAAMNYLAQVCDGLSFAHSRGVIHRDIKPQNLLLTADQRIVKIADFGVAKIKFIDGEDEVITRVGSDIYAPPEHHPLAISIEATELPSEANVLTQTSLTPAADIYSLAKTFYMMIAGESPRLFSQRPIGELPLHLRHESWAEAVRAVLFRATQNNSSARYQTVTDFWTALNNAVNSSASFTASLSNNFSNGHENAALPHAKATDSLLSSETVSTTTTAAAAAAHANASVSPTIEVNKVEVNPAGLRQTSVASPHTPNRIVVELNQNSSAAVAAAMQIGNGTSAGDQHANPNAKGFYYGNEQPRASSVINKQARRRLAVAAAIVALFGAMCYAAFHYLNAPNNARASSAANSSSGNSSRTAPASSTANNNSVAAESFVGREFFTTTDVKLRRGAGTNNPQTGLAWKGSRVKVLSENAGWFQVSVVEYSAPKQNKSDADQGWLNKNLVKLR